jgi:dienelactone hydrolase
MARLAVSLCALLLLSSGGLAQQASKPALTINDQTIGALRGHQVGTIILPQDAPPYPAVVVLHGCNGVSQATRAWTRRLASWGYAALLIDSFSSRGIENVCGRGMELSGRERAKDALAAAAYLRTRPDIDPDRIGLFGYSHGGWSALAAARENAVTESGTTPFAAVVAYYPNCPPGAPPFASDVQILIGDADDWTPAKRCIDLVARYAEAGAHRPLLKIYPGAVHSFDVKRPDRVYFGHRLAYDAKAAAESFDLTRQFLDSHLRRKTQ